MTAEQFALQVVQQLRQAGHQSFWAGGCVRDLLLGLQPTDYDVATSATPDQVRQLFGHRKTLAVGAAFGVIIVLSDRREHQIEVATFRQDADYSDGRRPDRVTFGTAQIDAQRRDFTINGIFYDPVAQEVIDYVGGQADLKDRILRAIGDPQARIAEDKLRMLRAVRFAARFDLTIEPHTLAALGQHSSEITLVSGERIAVELRKTLETRRPSWALRKWMECGLLRWILPQVEQDWPDCHQAAITVLDVASHHSWLARLAGILRSVSDAKQQAALIHLKSTLRMANDQIDAVKFCLEQESKLVCAARLPWSQIQPLMIAPWIASAVEMIELLVAADLVPHESLDWLQQRRHWPDQQLNPEPFLTGADLIARGMPPGPSFRKLLEKARQLQLDGLLQSRQDSARWLADQSASSDNLKP